jgi:hypothetical protein
MEVPLKFTKRLEFLVYAHEHGCAWHSGTLRGIVACRNWEGFKYALKNGCPYTADIAVAIVQHCPALFNYLLRLERPGLPTCGHLYSQPKSCTGSTL